ncbi:MAG: ABC transporter ATP-binding protein [Pseudomonadota bacterium]|nr:ABC transporter ATP-binding protein [Pseudomonadota bacterium]
MLSVTGLEAGYGGMPVLHGVSLTVAANDAVAVIGANGAGKSTLVRAICGLIPVTKGQIRLNDVALETIPAHERVARGLAVVLEDRHLFGELSVRNNLRIAAVHGARSRAGAQRFDLDQVLALFPFMRQRIDSPVELLSGGEQQMVAIARALLLNPDLLILDEPSTGLAPKVVKEIIQVIARLRESGMSILLIEQNVALASECARRAYVMAVGRLVHEIQAGEWSAFRQDETLLRAYLGGAGGATT